jgi:hypothetical protein
MPSSPSVSSGREGWQFRLRKEGVYLRPDVVRNFDNASVEGAEPGMVDRSNPVGRY